MRLRLEAHQNGAAGTLLQGIDDGGSQARPCTLYVTRCRHTAAVVRACCVLILVSVMSHCHVDT